MRANGRGRVCVSARDNVERDSCVVAHGEVEDILALQGEYERLCTRRRRKLTMRVTKGTR